MTQSTKEKPRVLVLDDEQANLDTFRRAFYKDFEIRLALHATEALDIIESAEFDVVVTDYSMPGIDGVEFARRAKVLRPDLGIIMVTGYSELDAVQQAMHSGLFVNLANKPWEINTLRSAIQCAASVARLNKTMHQLNPASTK